MGLNERAERWRADLESWAIPPEIMAGSPVSPWGFEVGRFACRTSQEISGPSGPTHERALEALPPGGAVLDVGSGTGAASLPLGAQTLIAVDVDPAMLAELARLAAGDAVVIEGRWPDVAPQTPVADVVVCSHVVFNVPDLVPFLAALDAHARRRVVIEIPTRHPTSWLNPLWLRFHGLVRPDRPTSDDVVAIAEEMGLSVRQEPGRMPSPPFESLEEMARSICRRLCLDPARLPEIEEAAREFWPSPPRSHVTLWWDKK